MTIPVLTIDGPSGAGKGTVSRAVAKKLGWNYLDSGSIYRSLAISALDKQVDLTDEAAIAQIAREMQLAFECNDSLTVKLDGVDITHRLPTEETGGQLQPLQPILRCGPFYCKNKKIFVSCLV